MVDGCAEKLIDSSEWFLFENGKSKIITKKNSDKIYN